MEATIKKFLDLLASTFEAFTGTPIGLVKACGACSVLLYVVSTLAFFHCELPGSSSLNHLVLKLFQVTPTVAEKPHVLGDQPEILSPFRAWLYDEGTSQNKADSTINFWVEFYETPPMPYSKPCRWALQCSPAYVISGHGFRVLHGQDSSVSYERLQQSSSTKTKLGFAVPPCDKGDQLIAVFLLASKISILQKDIPSIVHCSIE